MVGAFVIVDRGLNPFLLLVVLKFRLKEDPLLGELASKELVPSDGMLLLNKFRLVGVLVRHEWRVVLRGDCSSDPLSCNVSQRGGHEGEDCPPQFFQELAAPQSPAIMGALEEMLVILQWTMAGWDILGHTWDPSCVVWLPGAVFACRICG